MRRSKRARPAGPSRFAKGERELTEICERWNVYCPESFAWRSYEQGYEKFYDVYVNGVLKVRGAEQAHALAYLRYAVMVFADKVKELHNEK